MMKASVIISTWRRANILKKVLYALSTQTADLSTFEVLVVDSESGDNTQDVVNEFLVSSKMNLRLLQSINVLASKRNCGMRHAKGEYLIFLDDDCIPEPDHIESFCAVASQNENEKVIYCGGVKFSPDLVKKSNYYRYRNQAHFSKSKKRIKPLKFNNIVTMNMMINREVAIKNELFFDERFVGYGCEDIEYGWRSVQLGFRILPCDADILHEELDGNLAKFKKKIFHASRDGFPTLKKVAPDSFAAMGMTALLEPAPYKMGFADMIRRFLIRVLIGSILPNLIEKFLIKTDRIGWLYSYSAYRFVLAAAHMSGLQIRSAASQVTLDSAKSDGWYK